MPSLTEVFVEIRADVANFNSDLKKKLKGIDLSGDGKSIGGTFAKGFGLAAAAGGAAAGVALFAGAKEAFGREAATGKLTAQLGLTPAQSKSAGKIAGSLYSQAYGESFSEVSSAVGAVMSSISGLEGAGLEKVTAQALDFATVFDIDVTDAANAAGLAVRNGLAKDGTQALDLLTTSLQQVPVAMREGVLDASNEYAGFFDSLGIDGPQAFGLLVAGAKTGEQGLDKVGDALKEFTIRSTDGSKVSTDAYKAIGVSGTDMAAAILKGGDVAGGAFQKIIGGLQGIKDPTEQATAAIGLFGTPLEDLGVDNIPAFLASLSDAGGGLKNFEGSVDDAGVALNDNAATTLTAFSRQIKETFVDVVGGKVVPAFSAFVDSFKAGDGDITNSGMLGFFEKLGDDARFIFDELTGGINAFGAAWKYNDGDITSSGFPGFMEEVGYQARQAFDYFKAEVLPRLKEFGRYVIDTIVPALVDFAKWVAKNKDFFVPFVATIGTIIAALKVWAAVQGILNVVLAANPLGLVIIALAAFVGGLVFAYKNSETFREIVDKTWLGVRTAVTVAWEKFIKPAIASLIAAAVDAWETFQNLQAVLAVVWEAVKAKVKDGVQKVGEFIATLIASVAQAWEKFQNLQAVLGAVWESIKTTVKNGVRSVGEFFTTLIAAVAEAWETFQNLQTILGVVWEAIKTLVRTGVRSVVEFFLDMAEKVLGAADTAFGWIPGLGGKLDTAKKSFETFRDGVNTALDKVDSAAAREQMALLATSITKVPAVSDVKIAAVAGYKSVAVATGGWIRGPGTGTSDSIPARLSDGEFVHKAKAVNYYGPQVMDAINNMQLDPALLRGALAKRPPDQDWLEERPLKSFGGSAIIETQFQRELDERRQLAIIGDAPLFDPAGAARAFQGVADLAVGLGGTMKGALKSARVKQVGNLDQIVGKNINGRAFYESGNIELDSGTQRSLVDRRSTLVHELGHVLGLPHPNVSASTSVMYSSSDAARPKGLSNFDKAGLRKLFPDRGDVGRVTGEVAKIPALNAKIPAALAGFPGDYVGELPEVGRRVQQFYVASQQQALKEAQALFTPPGSSPNGNGGLGPRAQAAFAAVRDRFGNMPIGGYANRNIGGTNKLSKHAEGKAIDVMTYGNTALGQRVADFFLANRGTYAVDNIIWNRQIANAGRGWNFGRYNGQNPHTDHPHIDFFDRGGLLKSGSLGANTTGRPERVLTPGQTDSFDRLVVALEKGRSTTAPPLVVNAYGAREDVLAAKVMEAQRRRDSLYGMG